MGSLGGEPPGTAERGCGPPPDRTAHRGPNGQADRSRRGRTVAPDIVLSAKLGVTETRTSGRRNKITCLRSHRPSRSSAEVGTDTTGADPERPTRHRAHAARGEGRTVGGNNSRMMSTATAPRHNGLGQPPSRGSARAAARRSTTRTATTR
jgi:hypothetical protein